MSDPELERVLRQLAQSDARETAPPGMRAAVMAAWDDARQEARRPRSSRARLLPAVAALVAATMLAVAVRLTVRDGGSARTAADPGPGARGSHSLDGTAVVRLAADPTFESESLQLVRLRLPRTAVEPLGIALIEPDASGLIEIDVLVGGDGLPREIRGIRPVAGMRQ